MCSVAGVAGRHAIGVDVQWRWTSAIESDGYVADESDDKSNNSDDKSDNLVCALLARDAEVTTLKMQRKALLARDAEGNIRISQLEV